VAKSAEKKAKSSKPVQPAKAEPAHGYFAWSRDPAVGFFAVLPLWLLYELLRIRLTPEERNGAEILLVQAVEQVGPRGHLVLSAMLALCMVLAARSLVRRQVPWLRVAMVSALEGTVYGLLLGPLSAALASSAARVLSAAPAQAADSMRLQQDLVGAMGAGIFEELLFRLAFMSLLIWAWGRVGRVLDLPQALGGALAVVVSAVVFSWFHHVWGEPFTMSAFLFRAMAGVLLGILMIFRGYGVCVYTHVLYDVHYYLTRS
jgi:membrane protease YdiL (CAAX protease family)